MKGKQVKVIEYNLTFGSSARLVNILGLFRYKKNNSLYIIYTDANNNNYNIIYYGSSYIKGTTALSMECKDQNDKEIIKEYIYKVTNNENLDNYEMQPLDNTEGIEIISSNKLELKKEIIDKLIETIMPKEEKKDESTKTNKKKSPKTLLFLLILIIIGFGGYYLYTNYFNKETTIKQIICNKTYEHETLQADIEEEQVFNFNINDQLEKIDITKIYKFQLYFRSNRALGVSL